MRSAACICDAHVPIGVRACVCKAAELKKTQRSKQNAARDEKSAATAESKRANAGGWGTCGRAVGSVYLSVI